MRSRALVLLFLAACAGPTLPGTDAGTDAGPASAAVRFDLDGLTDDFYAFPFPSDLRLTTRGTPDLTGYPNPRVAAVTSLITAASERRGWPTIPVGYFRFAAPLAPRTPTDVIDATPNAPVLLVDVDPASPDRGALVPTIALTLARDRYTGEDLLAVASVPGWVLHPNRTYAFVIRRSLADASGAPLAVDPVFATIMAGQAPSTSWGARAQSAYAPLLATLAMLGVGAEDVAAATVFTTGDVVADLRELDDRVLATTSVTIEDLHLDPTDGAAHERYCELIGTVSMPQYQRGTPPFDTEGRFEIGSDGLPVEQRRETAPITITIPRGEMPAAGFPLMIYFHGSGGVAAQLVDRGPFPEGGAPAAGEGPAHVIAAHGFAAAGAALPLSPDRLPGASDIAYLNLSNLAAFPHTFHQGVIEQRLLIRALSELSIDAAVLDDCAGPSLPPGVLAYRFQSDAFVALGQSMGGMYANLVGATEPALRALVPTGAGGFWSAFIVETSLIPNVRSALGVLLRADGDDLTHLHPSLHLLELAWEAADPMVFAPRIARRPLPDTSPRPIYEPVGQGDSYFPTTIYDAMALAYGHRQAGEVVWTTMQERLARAGLDSVLPYPVRDDVESEAGEPYTGVVVQYAGDGFSDPHDIFMQLPAVRYQWGCFLRSAIDGDPHVVAPQPLGSPCN